ncbi:MAG: hypothetical protein A2X86_01800 [Bdellovibrionales bacterium GWA2_49_15]|nr:MAG: hypothetical protein A2X86_01800 [Bdellovibrionales bacterium GWA2_49_15]
MKKQLLSLALGAVLAYGAYANEEAAQLWTKRGESKENALKAANIVRDLGASEQNTALKADLKTREAEYIYYVGVREGSKDAKKKAHERGQDAAQVAVNLMANAKTPDGKIALARANYFFAINLGKWGEANGVLSSLGRWGELRDRLDVIDSLDKTVEDYGSLRTRARAFHKLPFGDKKEAEALLAEASENTLADGFKISRNSTTVFFYLDILAKNSNAKKFCEVYKEFKGLAEVSDEELAEYNAVRVPETKTDLENFIANRDFESDVKKYAVEKCK